MSEPPHPVVAIDGPSGSGKSTVARALAAELGFQYLDTGAMYRAVTLHFLREGIDPDRADLGPLLAAITLQFPGPGRIALNGVELAQADIRSREVEALVSKVSAIPAVRERMRDLQRRVADSGPVVAEGRDMASVVFPDARFKFYLDAAPAERARRRVRDFRARGREVEEDEVRAEIEQRDHLDSTRAAAPLVCAEGALRVDTTGMTVEAVIAALGARVREHGA